MDLKSFLAEQRVVKHGFRQYVDKHNGVLPPDDYVGHKNYLGSAIPLVKQLKVFKRKYVSEGHRFTRDEVEILSAAIKHLEQSLVPMAMIKKGSDEEIVIL